MTNGSVMNFQKKQVYIYRGNTDNADLSATQYLPASKLKLGTSNGTPNTSNTDLTNPIPIGHGTALDTFENVLTGSAGGDNSTDNTSVFKIGANQIDDTAQNLIANSSSATKTWTKTLGTNATATEYTSLWFYIKDATALAKFLSSGTSLEVKIGSDSSNYYSETYEASDLAVGWNWLDMGVLNLLTETGTVTGNIDTLVIDIVTNNATDTFVAGDVVADLLRQWEEDDYFTSIIATFPTIDVSALTSTERYFVGTSSANGFDINGSANFNNDTSKLMLGEDTFISESKGELDEFAFIIVDQIE